MGTKREGGVERTSEEMAVWYEMLCDKYPIVSIEDGLAEDDWDGFALMTEKLGKKIQIVEMIYSLQILRD